MSRRSPRASVVLQAAALALLGLLVCWQQASGQKQIGIAVQPVAPVPPQPQGTKPDPALTDPSGQTSNIDLVIKDRLDKQIEAAHDYIKVQEWAKAVEILQSLLDIEEDLYARVKTTGEDGKVSENIVNVRMEASRLVANLEPKGMEFYRGTYGAEATKLLREAKVENNDPAKLAKVMNRYLYTDAGGEATALLGVYHLDRGNYPAAALTYQKLIRRDGLKKMSPATLFRAALALHRAGTEQKEQKEQLEAVWKELADKVSELKLGRVTKTIDELKTYVASVKSDSTEFYQYDRPMVGGGPSRNKQGIGTTAFLEPRWKEELIRETATKGYYDQAVNFLQGKQPLLSASQPLAVTITRDNKSLPLVVYRSFWGIHARNVKTGELEWESPSNWSIDKVEREGKYAGTYRNWLQIYLNTGSKPELLFENSVVGTLSTDNSRVFVVEDLAIPPYTLQNPYDYGGRPVSFGGKLGDAVNQNILQAFDLDSGKLLWEAGTKEAKDDLSDSYFLGPPLPLNGKLYVLTEKAQALRLVTLDPATGKLLGKAQRLADTRDKMIQNLSRRINAAHPAYGEGMLVLPTNAGAMLGVDLLSGSMVWAYPYLEGGNRVGTQPYDPNRPGVAPPVIIGPDGRYIPQVPVINNWKNTPPVITEGKVVFAAPDASSVHCVNLQTGKRLWKASRNEDDLYLAGVFAGKAVVVGKRSCRGINMSDGTEAWRVDTGMPSGQGIASDNLYYLPVANSLATKEPGICIIDLNKGRLMAQTRSRKKEVPGNLLFYEGDVLSQTVTHLAIYPQLEVELKTIDEKIAKNSKDPEGLVRRGDLRLDKGDLKGAIEDLRVALDQKDIPKDLIPKARGKLFESFTELFQQDFNAAEKYLAEYEAMCTVPGDPAEEKRRKGNFYCLLGKGREEQKKIVQAFEAYMNFGTLGADQELMSVVDQPAVKASPAVWAQGRIASMVAKATEEERKPLENLIAKKFDVVKDGDLDSLRGFVATFGSLFGVGKQARLQLAERLIESEDPKALLDAERHLGILRAQQDDLNMAGRAVEALARLMTRKGLMEDAAYYYRVLGRDYSAAVLKDGKNGQDYYNELATDKRFLPYLDDSSRFGSGKWTAPKEPTRGTFPYQYRLYQLHCEGEPLPYFQRYNVKFSLDYNQIKVYDTFTNKEHWSEGVEQTYFAYLINNNYRNPQVQPRFPYQNLGHLVVVQLGHMTFALDPVNKQVLWKKNLSGQSQTPGYRSHSYDPRDGTPMIVYAHGWTQRLGQMGPLSPTAVVLQTSDGLLGVDPISGKTLWTRSDLPKSCHIFNDAEYVYIVEVGDNGGTGASKAVRMHDGFEVKTKDFGPTYQKRIHIAGRLILSQETSAKGGVVLNLYDVLAGKDAWSQEFPAGTHVLRPEADSNLVGAVEPDGKVTVVDMATQKVVLQGQMEAEHIAKVQSFHLLRDRSNVYVACNLPVDRQLMPWGGLMTNLLPGTGMQALPVNGQVYAWDLGTGKLKWHNPMPNQMIMLDQFHDLPIMLATVRYQRWAPGAMNQRAEMVVHTQSIDKRTGKLLFNHQDRTQQMQQFHAMNVDAKAGKIELIGYNAKVIHEITTDGAAPKTGGSSSSGTPGSTGTQGGVGSGIDPGVPVPFDAPIKRRIIRN